MAIRVLDDATAARIAAGEVVERPASVVKELVENALDAGATRIDIEVAEGGLRLARVVDNGDGIAPDEVELAFQRFATSKVDAGSDLLGIPTLGFRGEALPSIASVSEVEIASRLADAGQGERRTLRFGEVTGGGRAGMPPGTAVAVTNLFGNVPARRKFLRSPGTELGRVQQLVQAYALVRPDVAFRLTADGKPRLNTPGTGDQRSAVMAVYGRRVAEAMLELAPPEPSAAMEGVPAFSVEGLVAAPAVSRGNRGFITLAVNGRWIQSRRISYAVEQAYHGFLTERRFPVAVVRVATPLDDIDVNVHPAKTEVRFLREDIVFAEVQRAVRGTLIAAAPVPSAAGRGRFAPGPAPGPAPTPGRALDNPLWPAPAYAAADAAPGAAPTVRDAVSADGALAVPQPAATPHAALPVLRVIGQMQEAYLLAEGPDGLYLIDQHAAHERVRYEEITAHLAGAPAEAQQLLEPETVRLGPRHEEFLEAQGDALAGLGFVVEPFGPGTVLVRAIPKMLAERSGGAVGDALLRLLDEVTSGGRAEAWRDRLIATLACHSSVRAGMRLSNEEGRALVRQLERAEQPHTCPHGRPTMIHMSGADLERGFHRR